MTKASSSGDKLLRNPATGIAGCCERDASGQAAAAEPAIPLMKSRRLKSAPKIKTGIVAIQMGILEGGLRCPFWVKADIRSVKRHFRFTPEQTFSRGVGNVR
jgi:hypothetical protein